MNEKEAQGQRLAEWVNKLQWPLDVILTWSILALLLLFTSIMLYYVLFVNALVKAYRSVRRRLP